jgi:DNA-directed RNA polymerase subunit K/omega
MVLRPDGMGRFEFVVLARLRAHQLNRGCLSRIDGVHLRAVTAQLEVAGGHVVRLATPLSTDQPVNAAE